MSIKCCKDCVPPKRYPGCGANCPEYKEERKQLDKENELIRKNKNPDVLGYAQTKIDRFIKYNNSKKRRG